MSGRRAAAALAALVLSLSLAPAAGAASVYTVVGHGYGHGIGMGQYGALGYAQHGWSARRMLAHYYRGTRLSALHGSARFRLERVLLAQAGAIRFSSESRVRLVDEGSGRVRRLAAGSYRFVRSPRRGRMRLLRGSGRTVVVRRLSARALVRPGREPLAFGSGHWHGSFRVIRAGSRLSLIDVLPLEQYVRGVVPREVPASWPRAAVRAQAIAARSYAVATRNSSADFDAYADTRSQAFGSIEGEEPGSDAAVAATAHIVVTYRGRVAVTFYSASTGGRSASMQAAWGSSSGEPYLVSVKDPYDAARGSNPYHTWVQSYGSRRMARLLGLRSIRSFRLSIDRASRRVLSVTFLTRRRSVTRPATQVSAPLGLRSTYFRLRRVTLDAPSPLRRGHAGTLAGRIVPRFARRVALQRHSQGGAWVTVASLRVAEDGSFSRRIRPSATRSYRLALGRIASPVVRVAVRR